MKLAPVALAMLLAALAGGCGGDDEPASGPSTPAEAAAGPTAATGATGAAQVPPIPELESGSGKERERGSAGRPGSSPQSGPRPPARKPATGRARRVERYLRKNFTSGPGSRWYGHVERVSVTGAATTLETDLPGDRAGRRLAKQACLDLRGALPGITDVVRVTGTSGNLARCVP